MVPLLVSAQLDSVEIFNGPKPDKSKLYLYGALGANSSITRSTDPRGLVTDILSWEEGSAKLGFEIKTRGNWYYHLCYEYRSLSHTGRANAETMNGFWAWYTTNGLGLYVGKPIFFKKRELMIIGFNVNRSWFNTPNRMTWGWGWLWIDDFSPPGTTLLDTKRRNHVTYIGITLKRDFRIYHGFYLSLQYSYNQGLYSFVKNVYRTTDLGEQFKIFSRGTHYEALIGVRLKMFNLSS